MVINHQSLDSKHKTSLHNQIYTQNLMTERLLIYLKQIRKTIRVTSIKQIVIYYYYYYFSSCSLATHCSQMLKVIAFSILDKNALRRQWVLLPNSSSRMDQTFLLTIDEDGVRNNFNVDHIQPNPPLIEPHPSHKVFQK